MSQMSRTIAVGVVSLAVGAAVVGGVATAMSTAPAGTLHGCVSGGSNSDDTNPAGTLRVIDPSTTNCPKGDQVITFNQPPALPVSTTASGHKKQVLHAGRPATVISTKITVGKGYQMWAQPSLDVTTGAHRATLTVRLLVRGKPDGPAVTTTVPAHSSQDIEPLFLCDASMPAGASVVGIRVTSSAAGADVGVRTLLVQAAEGS